MNNIFIWLGILFCVSQSAIFSGLNLAFFSLTRLRLEIESEASPRGGAKQVLAMRNDSNFLLTTILWGNVGINVLLTLLSDSVMFGVVSFAFSTGVITLFGEIIPQAYFSRNALRMASLLSPVLRFYQILLYPVAKPSALLLDAWLGKESVQYFAEKNIQLFIQKHMDGESNEIDHIEGTGAINFLSMDDLDVTQEGVDIDPRSIVRIEIHKGKVIFPTILPSPQDPFIQLLNKSGKKWIILVDQNNEPQLVLDTDGYVRSMFLEELDTEIEEFCHKPLVIRDSSEKLDSLIKKIREDKHPSSDSPIDKDIVLVWNPKHQRIITGADILGRLSKGI